ncbi:MAG: hypothetical protein Q7U40_03075 [Desulfatirhabdiaceae bacterium]|nr:hypothetical protein [Desulfatirhabdiaceae bacterium]
MQTPNRIILMVMCLLLTPMAVCTAETDIAKALPAPACVAGWPMDGKVVLFDKDTLFDHINGESELYFPYGFEVLAFARYVNKNNPQEAFDADIYKMGSLLDAFGMYANYRRKDDADVAVGAEGTASSSQLLFYQDRYFVRLQASGTGNPGADIFLACARAISEKLPRSTGRPRELEVFNIPAVEPKSVRYIAQSLLGYDYFRKGIMADALLNDEKVQIFLVFESSTEAAQKVFDQYGQYLKTSDKHVQLGRRQHRGSLKASDPLYGNVVVEQAGRFIFGAVRIKDIPGAQQLVEKLSKRIAVE